MIVVGLILAAGLLLFGAGTAVRQRRTLRRFQGDRFIPSDERTYLRGQVRRRLVTSAVVVVIGGMIGWAFLSGMETRATEIADRARQAAQDRAADPDRPLDPQPPSADDRRFVKIWGGYWIAILILVFVAVCLAVFDFWATRRYWMAQYRLIRADHEVKLRRDLAVYRQTKDNDRLGRLRGKTSDDDTDVSPTDG